jgi:16S rRNA (adenine1518-N6/adenine1519-N6)-dimethyltransferase
MIDFPNMTSRREVIARMSRYGLRPHPGLGQNFLIDGNIVHKIIAAAELKPGDAVLEIGPGAGALTMGLARQQVRVLALELDQGLVALLRDLLLPFPQVTVLSGDALKTDFHALIDHYFPPGETVKLVSNLPYYLSSSLLYNLFNQKFPFSSAVLMFQKEVAQRVLASPGETGYGSLSVLCRYYTTGILSFNVSKNVFWPRPEVESAVIRLKPRPQNLDPAEEVLLWRIVKAAFQQRRKTLLNSLANDFLWSKDMLAGLLRDAGVDPGCRPESLSVDQFAKLTRIIYNYDSKSE